ncbi:MAG: NINE protein [Roseburia sp.]|uniref:TM2 domain-containing protein n=1 Tax=Roseburia sp. 831b TaxID=1261635 RepID=UPI0009522655|nr:TM2 domain-containing protein [Roseburia sp. 831b]MDD6216564.1 NINE protein [Roseburia sp.]MDY5882427.1 NINE protein [Roseburia sp.]WVK74094.1 NINE protein [Roseburia sp. 831b]
MYCRNCGQQYATDEAVMCVKCGVQKGTGNNFCPQCGQPTPPNSVVCLNCGVSLQNYGMQPQKSKMAAGLLGIFLGGWGIHNFYLGNTTRGIIQIIVTIVTCGIGAIWGLVEGIMILTGAINTDAKGNPLKD